MCFAYAFFCKDELQYVYSVQKVNGFLEGIELIKGGKKRELQGNYWHRNFNWTNLNYQLHCNQTIFKKLTFWTCYIWHKDAIVRPTTASCGNNANSEHRERTAWGAFIKMVSFTLVKHSSHCHHTMERYKDWMSTMIPNSSKQRPTSNPNKIKFRS